MIIYGFWAIINNSLITIDPILDTNDIRTALKQVGVISKQRWFSTFAHNIKIIYLDKKKSEGPTINPFGNLHAPPPPPPPPPHTHTLFQLLTGLTSIVNYILRLK